jgi:RNA polymerase primary sigma factor
MTKQKKARELVARVPVVADVEPLDRYFGELRRYPLLDAQQEIACAREIEALEVAHWRALLSHRRALVPIRAALADHVPGGPKLVDQLSSAREVTARSPATAKVVAQKLRARDAKRRGLAAADAAVQQSFVGDPGAQRFLARVAQARQRVQQAKGRFVAANLRLVISMARRYPPGLLPAPDLIQEGNLGLMHAVDRFDYRRGFRFSTYATWWVRHAFNRAISDKSRLVRVPVHALDSAARIERARSKAAALGGELPTDEAVARELRCSLEQVASFGAESLLVRPRSLDQPIGVKRLLSAYDTLPDPTSVDADRALELERFRADLPKLMSGLTSFEAIIVRFRFGLDNADELTLLEIGEKYNLSRERIRQIQAAALQKLRRAFARLHPERDDNDRAA